MDKFLLIGNCEWAIIEAVDEQDAYAKTISQLEEDYTDDEGKTFGREELDHKNSTDNDIGRYVPYKFTPYIARINESCGSVEVVEKNNPENFITSITVRNLSKGEVSDSITGRGNPVYIK